MKSNRLKGSLVLGLVVGASQLAGTWSASPIFGATAFAQAALDSQTRDVLIQKLTQVYLNLAPSDPSKVALSLRLADLHAERARKDAMAELASGCAVCTAGQEDRQKALSLYLEVLNKTPESASAKVLAQVGHLYEMTGNEKEAVATYEKILVSQKSPEALAEANLSLAEVYFKKHNYSKAAEHYTAVLAIPQAGSQGLAAYRLAWCEFNEGKLEAATQDLVKILKSPALLSRGAAAGMIQVDLQFQEEVSRDLATFLARRPVGLDDAKAVYELSPESAKMANVVYLASEVERLGQIKSAIELWRFAQEKQAKPSLRMEGHIRLAQLEMEQKLLTDATRDFDSALGLWTQVGECSDNDCREMKVRLRKFVVDWNRVEKKAPTEELLSAYKNYLKVFPQESDMAIWAGKVASDLKQYALAIDFYETGARLATQSLGQASDAEKKEIVDRVEAGLLGAIETAELSKDAKLLDTAYDSYLKLSQERKKAVEVQYQKAHLIYERGDYAAAADALREVAMVKDNGAGSAEIKKQAADLSLDALVLLKDDQKLEAWSSDYAKFFPKFANEFAQIARKSVLTQSAQAAAVDGVVGSAGLEAAWATLTRFDLATASPEEKASFYKNKLILAEKMQKFAEARDATESLLRLPNLTAADQAYALSRKAWLSELILDFDGALIATEKLPATELPAGLKWLKLAMYAELASKDSRPFYSQFLKETKDEEKSVAIAAQIVRESKEPAKEIEKQKALLAKRPEVFTALSLELYAKSQNLDLAKKSLAVAGVAKTDSGKVLQRVVILEDHAKLREKVTAHQLDGSNQKKMAQTLKARVAMLEEVEKLATRAVESGDWTSQLVTLDLLSKQSERFYQEILSLPVPAGLSGEEEQQYLMLLSQQAAPHQVRATDVAKKVGEFWANESAIAALDSAMTREQGPLRSVLVKEIKALAEVAPEGKKEQLSAMAGVKAAERQLPTLVQLEGARQALRESPMSRERVEDLLRLEKQMGRQAMVSYLEGRLQALDGAVK